MQESLKLTGELEIITRDSSGKVKLHLKKPNLIVTVGKTWAASALIGAVPYMNAIAVGTSSVPPNVSDVVLGAELARVAMNTPTSSGSTITYTATFNSGVGTGTWAEAGIFNSTSPTSGTMLSHTTFSPVTKLSTDVTTITWSITIN